MVDEDIAGPGWIRTWYLARPPVLVLTATTIVALLGGVLLWAATEWSFPAVGLGGVVLATGAAWVTTDYTAAKWRNPGTRSWKTFVYVAAGSGAVAVVLAEIWREPTLAFLGLMSMTVGIGPFVGEIRDDAADAAERWMQIGLVVGLVSAIAVGSPLPMLVRMIAAIGLLVGLGLFTGGLSTLCARRATPQSRALKIIPGDARQRGLIVGGVGLPVLLLGLWLDRLQIVMVGGWLTVVAMIMLSVKPARFEMSTLMKRSVLVTGIGLIGVAGYQLYATGTFGRSPWFVVFVVATVALAGAWIVWRGATLFLGVVFGFVFVWGLSVHTTSDPDHVSSVDASGDAVAAGIVAFGDSFISGEGAPEFYAGTDQRGSERNECRRAPTAYPVLISLDSEGERVDETPSGLTAAGLDFLACSGAKLNDVLNLTTDDLANDLENAEAAKEIVEETDDAAVLESLEPLEPLEPATVGESADDAEPGCEEIDEGTAGQYPCSPDGVYGSALQVEHVADNVDATQLVLLSIGGNDVRFGDIVAGCLLPGSCAERREVWLDNVEALGPELTEAYTGIRAQFSPSVPIVVMPYPLVLTEDACDDSPLDASEHEFIFEFTTVLNRQIDSSARQAGVHFFADGAFALEGNRLCESDDRAINLIRLQSTDGTFGDRINPGSWTHNSMHPNELGHEMIAAALTDWLDREQVVGSGNPEPVASSTAPLLDVRVARPYPVAPTVVDALMSRGVSDCGFEQIDSFATRIAIFDEEPGDGTPAQAFRVPVAGADPAARLCVTDSAGRWMSPAAGDDVAAGESATRLPNAPPALEVIDGRVFVSGGRPEVDCRSTYVPEFDERTAAALCDYQWILFSPPLDDSGAGDAARSWSLRAVQYCTTDPNCEDTFGAWTASQIDQAARRVGATIGLIFLGGWLTALGIELALGGRLTRRLRPPLGPPLTANIDDRSADGAER